MGYACDPHQRWADEGWGDAPEQALCRHCNLFEPSPYMGDDGGVCVFGTEVSQRLTHIEWHLGGDEACEEFSE